MKKHVFIAILLTLCAVCCAIGFAACKSDGKNGQDACTEHVWGEWVETAATCESAAFKQRACTVCGTVQREDNISPATGHAWSEWKEDPATCDDDGQRYRQCSNCQQLEIVTITKKGHAYEKVEWQWIDDEATAVFICVNDENHKLFSPATVTSETTQQPTIDADGEITYTATVIFNGKTYTKQKVESVPKLYPPYTVGLAYSEIKNGNEIVAYSVTGRGTSTETEITVPENYNNKPVSQVASRAFYGENITKLSLPSSVTTIGTNAFNGCTSLTDITLPDSIQSIGSGAFTNSGYYNDTDNWESSVLYIDNHLISVKANIAGAFSVKAGTVCIADYAIQYCTSLTDISIPESVTAIAYNSIYGCTELESITVDNANTVYSGAGNCLIEISTKILIIGCKNTVIPTDGSVETIYDRAFYNITDLSQTVIPDTVTTIGMYAYGSCKNLTQITFGKNVESIDYGAFFGCSNLKNISLPASVTNIGDRAFYDCGGLETIEVAADNTAFSGEGNCLVEKATKTLLLGCNNTVIPTDGSVEIIGATSFINCTTLSEIVIPDSVKTIKEEAFNGCISLLDVTVGSGVTLIERYSFFGCFRLETATFKQPAGWSWYKTGADIGTEIDLSNASSAANWLKSYNYVYKRV